MTYNKEWYDSNKEKNKEYRKKYKEKNKEKVVSWQKNAYARHKQRMIDDPEYRERYNSYIRKYRKNKPDVVKKAQEKYQKKIKSLSPEELADRIERRRARQRKHYAENAEKIKSYNKEYRKNNREKINQQRRERYHSDETYNRSWKKKEPKAEVNG